MELSAFSVVDAYPEEGPARDRYRELLELGEACDGAGFSAMWVAEHHFHPGGLCPAPPVLLAALGQRARRLRLGVLVTVLPLHSPIELAEQYGLLDQLLGGRLNLGVGSGYIPLEFEGFGVPLSEKRERFETHLELLRAAFRGEEVRLPTPGAVPVRLNVLPRQTPHPPITVAVQRRDAVRHLGARGLPIALIPYATLGSVAELGEEIREYRAALPPGTPGRVAVAVHVYAGERVGSARAALQRYLDGRLATQSTNYQARVAHDPRQATAGAIEASGFAVLGAPDGVADRLHAFERAGVDELLGIFDFGGLAADEVLSSVRALGRAWTARP